MNTNRSWLHIPRQDPAHTLAAAGLPDAEDCGWVEQMTPFLLALTQPGDRVLDPFCGWASTLLAAGLCGRRGLGCEIDGTRAAAGRHRLAVHGLQEKALIVQGDSRHLPFATDSMAACLTSIPYFGPRQQGGAWADKESSGQCYAQSDYAAYQGILNDVLAEVARALAPGASIVAMAENVRIDGRFVPLAWDCARLLANHFELCDERIITYERPTDALGDGLRSNRAHEYALIGRKR